MKKIFTLFAVAVMTMAANAQSVTEAFGSDNNSAKDTEVVCPGFKIDGTYVASGSSKVNVYDGDKGMKMRANKTDDTLILTVDEGTKITALKMGVVVNDANETFSISGVTVNGEAVSLTYPIVLPNTSDADGAAIIDLSDIAATETIGIKFEFGEYGGKNKQVFIAGEVTYEPFTSSILSVAADAENAPVYNVMGVQVDNNYKGLVIKNGKKYMQR